MDECADQMKIILHNFMNYKNAEYTVPSSGMVLLYGPSGKGKTTLLLAFLYVLYGNVRKVASLNDKKSKTHVTLVRGSTTIMRSSRPSKIVVTTPQVRLEEAEAQSFIDSLMGMNGHEFLMTHALVQGNKSILAMTAAQILQTIEKLTCPDEVKKQRFKVYIKDEIAKSQECLSQLQVKIQIETQLAVKPKSVDKAPKAVSVQESMSKIKCELLLQETELASITKTINQVEQVHAQQESLTKLMKQKKDMLEKYPDVGEQGNLSQLAYECDELSAVVSRIRSDVQTWTSLEKRFNTHMSKVSEYTKSIPVKKQLEERVEWLKQTQADQKRALQHNIRVKKQISELHSQLEEYGFEPLVQIEDQRQHLVVQCPACQDHIKIAFEHGTCVSETCIPQDQKQIEMNRFINYSAAVSIVKQVEKLKEMVVPAFKEVELAQAVKTLESLPKECELDTELQKEYETYKDKDLDLDRVAKMHAQKRRELLKKQECKQKRQHIHQDMKELQSELARLDLNQQDMQELDGRRRELSASVSLLKTSLAEQHDLYTSAILYEEYVKKAKEYNHHIRQVKELHAQVKAETLRLEQFLYASECVEKAQLMAVEEIIHSINSRIKFYLQQFFSDPITVGFQLGKEVGQGCKAKVKLVLNVNIVLNGAHYDRSKDLSKGEHKRVKLAVLMAFADIVGCGATLFRGGFFLLDECLSNLHSDLQTEILQLIKQRGSLLLVVSHDAVKGIFDHVITWE